MLNKTMLKLDFRIKRANIGKYRHLISKEILVGNTGEYLYFYNSPYAFALRLVNHCPIEVIVNENEHILLNSANDLEDMVNNINIDKKEEVVTVYEIKEINPGRGGNGVEIQFTANPIHSDVVEKLTTGRLEYLNNTLKENDGNVEAEESTDNTKVEDSIKTEDEDSGNNPVEVNDEDDNVVEESDGYTTEDEEETSDVMDNKPEEPVEEKSKEKNIVLTLKKKS
jgi:hypothetical protein